MKKNQTKASVIGFDEAAAHVLSASLEPKNFWAFSPLGVDEPRLGVTLAGDAVFVRAEASRENSRFVFFDAQPDGFFEGIPDEFRWTVLTRCLKAALTKFRQGSFLSPSWAPYTHDSFQMFYAATITQGRSGFSPRAILRYNPSVSPHVYLVEYWASSQMLDLRTYQVRLEAEDKFASAVQAIQGLPPPMNIQLHPGEAYLRPLRHALEADHGYSEWLSKLTKPQTSFVNERIVRATRLRGAAGTGKTLVLTLKAIKEAYEGGKGWRGLIVTHNMSAAEMIIERIRKMDSGNILGKGGGGRVDVTTLHSMASDLLQLAASQVRAISEDGYEGKTMQLEALESIAVAFREGDLDLFRRQCSAGFLARLQRPKDSQEFRSFCWDLMNEFACVLGAERSMTKEHYLGMTRLKWMVKLENKADREVVYNIYRRFRAFMRDELVVLSTHDVVNDLLRYLDSNTWEMRRKTAGYDLVLVDEFHLFNRQEQLVFQYLGKDPEHELPIVLALDPAQSPSESFIGVLAETDVAAAQSLSVSGASLFVLDTPFRYTEQIGAVVKNLNEFWFSYDLLAEFSGRVNNARGNGPVPTLHEAQTWRQSVESALEWSAEQLSAHNSSDWSVAVLCVGYQNFKSAQAVALGGRWFSRASVIESRDDAIDGVRRGRFVVSQPEYVAGLQFDAVVILDASADLTGVGMEDPLWLRRVLSGLYLGVSRARTYLRFYCSADQGGVVKFIEPSLKAGLIVREALA